MHAGAAFATPTDVAILARRERSPGKFAEGNPVLVRPDGQGALVIEKAGSRQPVSV